MPAAEAPRESILARWAQPQRAFVLIAFVFGQALVLLIPPFQSADEPYHFYRAYQITEGTFIARQMDIRGFSGGYLPISLYKVWLPFSRMGFHLGEKMPVDQLRPAFQIPLDPQNREFITLPSTAHYSPACYLPQCAGIIIGRLFGQGPLAMLYLARECNLLARIALGYFALKWAPAISRPLMLVLLIPMSLYVGSSASADVPTDAFAIAFCALVFRHAPAEGEPIDPARLAILWLLSLAVCLCKFAYAPLLAMLLLVSPSRFGGRRGYWTKVLVIIAIDLLVVHAWTSRSAGVNVQIRMSGDVSAVGQIQYLQDHPLRFGPILIETFRRGTWMLCQTFVGVIGWYDMFLPTAFVAAYLLVIVLACATPDALPARLTLWRSAVVVVPVIVISLLIIALLSYLYWTPVGAVYIDGMHGRYLIPLAPAILILMCVAMKNVPRPRLAGRREIINGLVAAASICASLYFLAVVWNRYYGQG